MRAVRGAVGAGMAALLLVAGCATAPTTRTPTAGATDVTANGDAIAAIAETVTALSPQASPVMPGALMPEETIRGVFRRTAGDGTVQESPFVLEPTDSGWTLTIERLRREFYALNDAGDLTVLREDDFVENARVEYEPALVVLPANRARAEGRSTMTVLDAAGERRRDRGEVAYTVEVLGRRPVATPAGVVEAVVTRMTRTIDLSLADVEVESVDAYATGAGPVAETARREIRALGLFSDRSSSRLERTRPKLGPSSQVAPGPAR